MKIYGLDLPMPENPHNGDLAIVNNEPHIYSGGRWVVLSYDLSSIPVDTMVAELESRGYIVTIKERDVK